MSLRIFLAGATGVIGRRLLPALVGAGHRVTAMTRHATKAPALAEVGATPVVCDVFDKEGLRRAVVDARPEVVIHQLTSLPARINPRRIHIDLAENDRVRRIGTRNLVDAAVAAGARRVVSQSIAFAYAPGSGLRVESDPLFLDAPPRVRPLIEAVAALETSTLETPGIEGLVLRYGFFYGPGSVYDPGGSFHEDVMRRRIPRLGDGTGVFSFIHVDDAVQATLLALTSAPTGTYNIVDGSPLTAAEWLPAYAAALGAPKPWWVPRWLGALAAGPYAAYLMERLPGASNAKAMELLGFRPAHPRFVGPTAPAK